RHRAPAPCRTRHYFSPRVGPRSRTPATLALQRRRSVFDGARRRKTAAYRNARARVLAGEHSAWRNASLRSRLVRPAARWAHARLALRPVDGELVADRQNASPPDHLCAARQLGRIEPPFATRRPRRRDGVARREPVSQMVRRSEGVLI